MGVTNPEQDLSVGRFPDGTGGYGVIFAGATPGAPNMPTDLGASVLESGIDYSTIIPDCGQVVEARFRVTLDEDRKDTLEARLEYADIAGCDSLVVPEEASFTSEGVVISIESEEPAPPEMRVDIENETVTVPRVRITYLALIAGAPCGTARTTRVFTSVEGIESQQAGDCLTWDEGQQLPTIALNEYVPRNRSLQFSYIRREDVENGTPDPIPEVTGNGADWIEVHNYGDEPLDVSDFSLVGLREWNEFTQGGVEDIEPWIFLDDSKNYEFRPDRWVIEPGCFVLLVTDNDGGGYRRSYRLVDETRLSGDPGCQLRDPDERPYYYSTDFRLEATPDDDEPPDGVVLLDPQGRRLDVIEILFDEIPDEFREPGSSPPRIRENVALGRPPAAEATYDSDLRPGEFLCLGTPGGDNALICEVPPQFRNILTCLLYASPSPRD